MFDLCRNQVVCFYLQNVLETPMEEGHFRKSRRLFIRLCLISKFQRRIQNPVKHLKIELFAKIVNGFAPVNHFFPEKFHLSSGTQISSETGF